MLPIDHDPILAADIAHYEAQQAGLECSGPDFSDDENSYVPCLFHADRDDWRQCGS